MTQDCFCFTNIFKVLPDSIVQEDLFVQNGKIVAPTPQAKKIDCHGAYAAPGLIDLQINGLHGIDFTTHPEKISEACRILPRYGVTSFLATILSQPESLYKQISKKIPRVRSEGANFLGIHFEGPFLNPQYAGAHPVSYLQNECFSSLFIDETKLVTLAPELPKAMELIEWLTKRGIRVACGHTGASIAELEEAKKRGVVLTTHLFNAMASFHHRHPGIIGYTLGSQSLMYSIIADGRHLAKEAIQLAYHAHPKGMIAVSDASSRLGSPTGTIAGQELIGDAVLAGSRVSLFDCVHHLVKVGCSLPDAVMSATLRPAALLGFDDKKGKLSLGFDADFILFTKHFELKETYIGGNLCFRSSIQ